MSKQASDFLKNFGKKDFVAALSIFNNLADDEKLNILADLFQKSEYHRIPDMMSVLYRDLYPGKSFDDFHQAWFPPKEFCNPVKIGDQVFQQGFPATVRVLNALNLENPNEVISIGLSWVENKEQEKKMWEAALSMGKDTVNQIRSDNISTVAKKISSKLYKPRTDDNLGVPF